MMTLCSDRHMLPPMTEQKSNAGEIAVDLMWVAEELVDSGEDPEDVRAAFVAVSIRLKQLRDEADNDARDMILRSMG